jgi:hypothetical protein
MAAADKPLWEYTRDLHHACEAHPVGNAMSKGNPPHQWYNAWLNALKDIHAALDPHAPEALHRRQSLFDDVVEYCHMGYGGFITIDKAKEYVDQLDTENKIAAAIYVLTGAHMFGGEIMRRRLEGYPTNHLVWPDRKQALALLQQYRTRDDIGDEARDCFKALLAVMDEILQRYPVTA